MDLTDVWNGKRTTYTIVDEFGERSSITIDKWAADYLQDLLPDVHSWIQLRYELVANKHPSLSRRMKGSFVRELARRKAREHESYVSLSDLL